MRVQDASFSFTHPAKDIKEIGSTSLVVVSGESPIIRQPNVKFDMSYLFTSGENESALGLYVGNSGSMLKRLFEAPNTDDINIFVVASNSNSHKDLNYITSENEFEGYDVIGFGNCFLTKYSYSASIGSIPKSSVSYDCSNMKFDNYSVGSEPTLPAINISDGTGTSLEVLKLNENSFDDHVIQKQVEMGIGRAMMAGDMLVTITKKAGNYGGAPIESAYAAIQNININIPISREDIFGFGSNYAYNRKVKYPVIASVGMDMIVREFSEGDTHSFFTEGSRYDMEIQHRTPLMVLQKVQSALDSTPLSQTDWYISSYFFKAPWLPASTAFFQAKDVPQWCYSSALGWVFIAPTQDTSVWFWQENMGWNWTSKSIMQSTPYTYNNNSSVLGAASSWVYWAEPDSSAYTAKVYNYSDQTWRNINLFGDAVAGNSETPPSEPSETASTLETEVLPDRYRSLEPISTFKITNAQLKAQNYKASIGSSLSASSTFSFGVSPYDGIKLTAGPYLGPTGPYLSSPVDDVSSDHIYQGNSDASNVLVDLTNVFSDNTENTPSSQIVKTLQSNSNSSLVVSSIIGNTLTLNYQSNQSGVATIVVRATLDSIFVDDTFTVTVRAADQAPTVENSISNVTVKENSQSTIISLKETFEDADSPEVVNIDLAASSSNTSIVSPVLSSSNGFGLDTLELVYVPNSYGTVTITVTATSRGLTVDETFTVEVQQNIVTNLGGPILGGVFDTDELGEGVRTAINAAGNVVALGAPGIGSNPNNGGRVRVFVYDDDSDTWSQRGNNLTASGVDDDFGTSVALNAAGDTLAVGAPQNGSDTGYVIIYKWGGTSWEAATTQTAFRPESQDGKTTEHYAGARFGQSVSLNDAGDKLAVGAPSFGINSWEKKSGLVKSYFFVEKRKRHAIHGGFWPAFWYEDDNTKYGDESFDYFGTSVSLNGTGDRLAVGAILGGLRRGPGSVKIYQRFEANSIGKGDWSQLGATINGETDTFERFGERVELNTRGNVVAISAPHSYGGDTHTPRAGKVRIYELMSEGRKVFQDFGSEGNWGLLYDIDGEEQDDYFGKSISLNGKGDTIAIGAFGNDSFAQGAGKVRIYKYGHRIPQVPPGFAAPTVVYRGYFQEATDLNGSAADDQYGRSVALNKIGDRVVIGSPKPYQTSSYTNLLDLSEFITDTAYDYGPFEEM
jgi:hypothetical protein